MAPVYEPTTTRKGPRWADLMKELVEEILRRLPLDDYFSFGLVCKPWWSAMIDVRRLFKPPTILILPPSDLRGPGDRASEAEASCLYAVRGGGEHCRLPLISHSHGVPAARCCGTSMGWLFMVGIVDESRSHLLNPISRERVELPAFPPFFTLCSMNEVLCSSSASDLDCIVAVQGETLHTVLLTCRPKDDEWREIPYNGSVRTFAFCEGRLYFIVGQGMDIYDFDPDQRKIGSVMCGSVMCGSVMCDGIGKKRDQVPMGGIILVNMEGKLMLVRSAFGQPCRVYELVDNRWVKIHSLGEWALMMNRFTSQAFSINESLMLGFRANCIYQAINGIMDMYSMKDGCSLGVYLPGGTSDWLKEYPTLFCKELAPILMVFSPILITTRLAFGLIV